MLCCVGVVLSVVCELIDNATNIARFRPCGSHNSNELKEAMYNFQVLEYLFYQLCNGSEQQEQHGAGRLYLIRQWFNFQMKQEKLPGKS